MMNVDKNLATINLGYEKIVPVFFVLSCILPISPLINYSFGTRGNLLCAFLLFIYISLMYKSRVGYSVFAFLSVFAVVPLALSLYWSDAAYVSYSLYFIMSFLSVSYLNKKDAYYIVYILSNILLMILFGAFFSFVYALLGGGSIFEVINPDGRESYLYVTSMTNWVLGNLIRPSGIFDEPGTLSFLVCFVCAARHLLGFNKKNTWVMLALGFVTLSVAHGIYVFFHLLSERLKIKHVLLIGVAVLCVFLLISLNSSLYMLLDEHFLSRFTYVSGKGFVGDNRTLLLSNAVSMLSFKSFIFGIDSSCISNVEVCDARYNSFGENPLSLLVLTGIGLSFPYYIILVLFFWFGIQKRSNLVLFALGLLLLQRPYVMSYGYSLLIMLLLKVGAWIVKNYPSREWE